MNRTSNTTVLVAHSSPLIAAGLTSLLRRLEGCDVRVWNAISDTAPCAGSVAVVDDLALAAQLSTSAGAGGEPIRVPTPKVVLLTNGARQMDRTSNRYVSAWLSINSSEEELLGAVQVLLQDALLARGSPPIRSDTDLRVTLNPVAVTSRAGPISGLAPKALKRVREHIEAYFAQKIDVSRLASVAGLSTSYFSRAFKRTLGMSPHRYVMMRRLAAAAELITKTSKPLAGVAIEVGFSDQSHFTRVFAQTTGETPGALRRRYR